MTGAQFDRVRPGDPVAAFFDDELAGELTLEGYLDAAPPPPTSVLVSHVDTRLDASPGATSEVSNSVAYVAGAFYIVAVTQFRQSSLDPDTPTLSGWGTTWSPVNDNLWTSTGTNRRRTTVFTGTPPASGTGVLTASYSGQPANIVLQVLRADNAAGSIVQVVDGTQVAANGAVTEPVTIASPASADNRVVVFVAANTNVSATARLELDADSGGDADWSTFTVVGSGTAPTGTWLSGWLDADPAGDLTPGWFNSTGTPSSYLVALELAVAAANDVTVSSGCYAGGHLSSVPVPSPSTSARADVGGFLTTSPVPSPSAAARAIAGGHTSAAGSIPAPSSAGRADLGAFTSALPQQTDVAVSARTDAGVHPRSTPVPSLAAAVRADAGGHTSAAGSIPSPSSTGRTDAGVHPRSTPTPAPSTSARADAGAATTSQTAASGDVSVSARADAGVGTRSSSATPTPSTAARAAAGAHTRSGAVPAPSPVSTTYGGAHDRAGAAAPIVSSSSTTFVGSTSASASVSIVTIAVGGVHAGVWLWSDVEGALVPIPYDGSPIRLRVRTVHRTLDLVDTGRRQVRIVAPPRTLDPVDPARRSLLVITRRRRLEV